MYADFQTTCISFSDMEIKNVFVLIIYKILNLIDPVMTSRILKSAIWVEIIIQLRLKCSRITNRFIQLLQTYLYVTVKNQNPLANKQIHSKMRITITVISVRRRVDLYKSCGWQREVLAFVCGGGGGVRRKESVCSRALQASPSNSIRDRDKPFLYVIFI